VLGLAPEQVRVHQPDTRETPDSGTTTASRQTLITGEACRRACMAAREALAAATASRGAPGGEAPAAAPPAAPAARPGRGTRAAVFPLAPLAGRRFTGEYEAVTDPFETDRPDPVRHVAYSYACQLVLLGPDGRVAEVLAAHDSGVVVNPLSFEGQVEGGVVMGLGFALTERLPLVDSVPSARFAQLGLLRAPDAPAITTIIVRRQDAAAETFGAKGIGEISTIPTAAAVAGAYFALDGKLRTSLPLEGTPYYRPER